MALFEKLKDTKLKSLKFGQTGTAGDSTKPYIVTDINTVDTPLNKFRLTKFDDGLIRGGAVGATNASVIDTLRVGKFLTDFPRGPLFIAKQVGLQLSNPSVETKQLSTDNTSNSTLGKIIAGASNVINKLNNLVGGPTRIYNLGINTLAQVPVNAFGGHINRHGFLPRLDDSQKYESVVTNNNKVENTKFKTTSNNRLVKLYNDFFNLNSSGTTLRANVLNNTISDNFGGAKSVYGIGRTTLLRTIFTGRETSITEATNKIISKTIQQGVSEHVYDDNTIFKKYQVLNPSASIDQFKQGKTKVSNDYSTDHIDNITGADIIYEPLYPISNKSLIIPFSSTLNVTYNKLIEDASRYEFLGIKATKEIVTSGQKSSKVVLIKKPLSAYSTGSDYGINTALANIYERTDENILQVTFTQIDPFTAKTLNTIPFSAYLSGYTENYDSSWDSIKYNGRADFLYTFNSYKKTASFKLQIPIFNKNELKSKHEALKKLQTGLAGKYLDNRLGGILTRINLGYYLYNSVCIINNLSISIPNDVSWDWAVDGDKDLAYAMLLEATFQVIVVNSETPGFNETTVTPPKPKIVDPKPKPDPKPVSPTPVTPPKVKVNIPGFEPIEIDSTRVERQGYVGGLDKFRSTKFGGGDFGGGGAGDGF